MPLVDYASSDEGSGNESGAEEDKKVLESVENESKSSVEDSRVSDSVNGDDNAELFTSLPKPRKTFSILEDDNKLSKLLLNKNSLTAGGKTSVKISVPSVSEFEDDEQPAPKKIKPSAKGAGLFSVLPPPKNATVKQTNRTLVPHVLSKNQVKQSESREEMKNKFLKKHLAKGIGADEEDDDDTPVGTSFFGSSLVQQNTHSEYSTSQDVSMSKASSNFAESGQSFVSEIPMPKASSNFAESGQSFVSEIPMPEENHNTGLDNDNYSYSTDPSQAAEPTSASDNPLHLDEKALQILCGNKKKRQGMPMNVIDLSGEEILPDSKEWLLKQFTEEKRVRSHSHKKHSGPSSQSRRKHQITYLAYQAKEQELELQNQWANNRMSRKQTQSKYGF